MPGYRNWGSPPPWMQEYNRVRDAGWAFDRQRRCWYHATGRVWAACNQSTILRHILEGTEVPTRDEPPIRDRDAPALGSLEVQISLDTAPVARAFNELAVAMMAANDFEDMERVARAGAGRHMRRRNNPIAADWQPNVWEA